MALKRPAVAGTMNAFKAVSIRNRNLANALSRTDDASREMARRILESQIRRCRFPSHCSQHVPRLLQTGKLRLTPDTTLQVTVYTRRANFERAIKMHAITAM